MAHVNRSPDAVLRTARAQQDQMMKQHKLKRIFISHSVTDREIAERVVDLLNTAMNINVQEDVFCASLEGLGIPAGLDFKAFIKAQIQEPQLVLLLISQNYLASQFCLAEVGATEIPLFNGYNS